jgi:hypothetical protein
MKLKREMISYLATKILRDLTEKGLVDCGEDVVDVTERIGAIIYGDLHVEDDLNDEVKTLLEKMSEELDRSQIDYRKMFQMVKQKLARERGIIL